MEKGEKEEEEEKEGEMEREMFCIFLKSQSVCSYLWHFSLPDVRWALMKHMETLP